MTHCFATMLTHGDDDLFLVGSGVDARVLGVTTGIDVVVDGLVACGVTASPPAAGVAATGTETSEGTTSPAPSVVSRGLLVSTGVVAATRAAVSADAAWAFD